VNDTSKTVQARTEKKYHVHLDGCGEGNEFPFQFCSYVVDIRKTNFHFTVVNGNAKIWCVDTYEKEANKHTLDDRFSLFRQAQKIQTKVYLN
jgi:hypothetical protein